MVDINISILIAIIVPFFLYMVDRMEKMSTAVTVINHNTTKAVELLKKVLNTDEDK